MKKSVLALAMAFGVTSAFAQDLTSKKGEPILPEAGDWGISVLANPFLSYIGTIGSASNTAPAFNFINGNNLIMGRYFKDEKTVYRAGLNIGINTQSWTTPVYQDGQTAPAAGVVASTVNDKKSQSTTGIGLTAGIEKRKGKTRLQGYYGAELGIYFSGIHDKYTYGNAFDGNKDPNPTTANFGPSAVNPTAITSNIATTTPAGVTSRYTDIRTGTAVSVGVRGFLGVEYFIIPKISLGGEFGWGIGVTSQGAGQATVESIYKGTSPSTETVKTGKSSNFNIGTDNKNNFFGPTGQIRMNFYF
jgi:hypothetical protein